MHFEEFARVLESIEIHASNNTKMQETSWLFTRLREDDSSEVVPALYLCQGRILAEGFRSRSCRSLEVSRRRVGVFLQSRQSAPNLETSPTVSPRSPDISLNNVVESLSAIYCLLRAKSSDLNRWLLNQQPVPGWLVDLSGLVSPCALKSLGRILAGPVVDDKTLIAALSAAAGTGMGTQKAIEKTFRYTVPDLGIVAATLMKEGYWAVREMAPQAGIPTKPQEITRWDTVDAAWQAIGVCRVQPKVNGWQIQIHKSGHDITLFDRKLDLCNRQFADIVEACRVQISAETAILDCEVVGYDPTRGRILALEQIEISPHHKAFVFDILMLNGTDWRVRAYHERRRQLSELLGTPTAQEISPVYEEQVSSCADLNKAYVRWSEHGDYEGIIVIDPDGPYLSGRKTKQKGKLKPYVSLDVIVLGHKLSVTGIPSFLVGVWNKPRSRLIPIGWVEGVVSRKVADRLLVLCQSVEVATKPASVVPDIAPRTWAFPEIVVEVEAEGRQSSNRCKAAGYELYRSKRLRIRTDLEPNDADDIHEFMTFPVPPGQAAQGVEKLAPRRPLPHVTIYTDGACKPNPGPGGWAAVLRFNDNEKVLKGSEPNTTNNRMELRAAVAALQALTKSCRVDIFVDSQYLHRGITEWLPHWQARHWRTSDGEPVRNEDLWQELRGLISKHNVDWHWIRGHVGHPENERANELAREEMLKAEVRET